jgi:NAD(P)-dependent dehydrogenase (short-subunit alcohol dehydrogenase family)
VTEGAERRLSGRVAVITGATSGIGAATAKRLVAEGANTAVCGRSAARGGAICRQLGARAFLVVADLREPDAASRVVQETVDRCGRIDILVNNAAVDHTGDLLTVPTAEVKAVFETNVFAALAMFQAAASAMGETGGTIVNVTSRLASIGVPGMSIYSASKGALLALTRSAAVELGPRGIRVNAVAPGMTRTELYEAWIDRHPDPAATEADVVGKIPLGSLADPDDVAAAIAFLVSDDARHITGASIPVDGGYTAA